MEDYEVQNFVQTEASTDEKCPNCGATVSFDPAIGKLHCDYCGFECELPKPEGAKEVCEMDFYATMKRESFEWGAEKKSVQCKSCGAVSIYDALETSAVCPFCGSNQVMAASDEKSIAPGGVCPFTVTKENAGTAFTKWISKKFFAPSKAKKNARPDAFQGVYLPYWTYDSHTFSFYSARAGFDRTVKKGDKTETVTDWRHVEGYYQKFFDDVTVVASKRHGDTSVKDCEPFDLMKAVPYDPKLLAGFAAERYSIGLEEGWELAQKTMQSKLKEEVRDEVKRKWHADRADSVKLSTDYIKVTYKYLLVPIWVSSYKYNDKIYQFVVNGQTGKVGGKSPVSVWKVLLTVLLSIGAIVGLYFLLK